MGQVHHSIFFLLLVLLATLLKAQPVHPAPNFSQIAQPSDGFWVIDSRVQDASDVRLNSTPSSALFNFIMEGSSFATRVKSAWQLDNLVSQDPDEFRSHWPEFELSWRLIIGSFIGFVGAALGSVGGVGGGGIFVPMLNVIMGFDSKTATALSKSMIMGAAVATSVFNLKVKHPTEDRPVVDYGLAVFFQPMLLLGVSIGVMLNVIFADWMLVILLIVIFLGLSWNAFLKGVMAWRQEVANEELSNALIRQKSSSEEGIQLSAAVLASIFCVSYCQVRDEIEAAPYATISANATRETEETWWHNVDFKDLGLLFFVWLCFLIIQIAKMYLPACGLMYWILSSLQVPVALSVTISKAFGLFRKTKQRSVKARGFEFQEDGEVEWETSQLSFCIFCGLSAGVVGGLLGVGGGSIIGPLLLEIGIAPQATSATATFIMIFSASMTAVEYYLMGRIPTSYGVYLVIVSMSAGFWGQYFVSKAIKKFKRPSIIIFVLASTIAISAMVMGFVGVIKNLQKFQAGEYMGFESFCPN